MPARTQNPVTELRAYLERHASRCRFAGWLGSLFHVQVAQDIAADVAANEAKCAREAHLAEVEDSEAINLLSTVLSDGKVTADEIPVLRDALRHVRHSARVDHNLTERLST